MSIILESGISGLGADLSQLKTLNGAKTHQDLKIMVDLVWIIVSKTRWFWFFIAYDGKSVIYVIVWMLI